ncbi:arsenic resistance protein [Corynebacterium sp.]|uniref:arsenic resistance protein n=1 Tax=Corynebacterium sp. TaxID=1720 RepID=UPI0026DAA390|nr:arsenic resistance protein [Corynebacterium sp.]MDO5076454.1 arsenic resistance protein [Corynebacterium sp.]
MELWLERNQVSLYVFAILLGAAVGYVLPGGMFEAGIQWSLMLLLYATFLAVPFRRLPQAFADVRFMVTLLALNFLAVPGVVFVLTRHIVDDQALLIGVLLVLLTPCVDYVIVFTRLARGNWNKILAATPLLMLLQIVFLPVFLTLFGTAKIIDTIQWGPFIQAFLLLIIVPLLLSIGTQLAEGNEFAHNTKRLMEALMVPLMMLTLFLVVASQFGAAFAQLDSLLRVIPIYVAFLLIMPVLACIVGKGSGQSASERRALAFSSSTRNSLVVLPLALALPGTLSFAALVVVTQTLVELVGMVTFVRVFPSLIVDRAVPEAA